MKSDESNIILKMTDIEKSFPGVKALDKAKLILKKGSVHALMGENGAGKSTLMKCLFGVYSKDSGKILLDGEEINFKNSKQALENGVAMVHQELNQALKLSVCDNMWLGRFINTSKFIPILDEKKMLSKTKEIFKQLDIDINPKEIIGNLSVSQRQMAEIAKAVSYNSKVIVFDEPTSSLTQKEAQSLFKIIEKLKNDGVGIIYISHKMEEILKISDTVTVMRDGKWVATESASNMTINKIIKLMVGRELTDIYPKKSAKVGKTFLEVRNLTAQYNNLRNVSFSAAECETVGIAGLDGSGRSELLECLFGLSKRKAGEIFLNGKKIKNRNPRESIENGFALITEERRADGIFSILSIRENSVISSLDKYKKFGLLSKRKMELATLDSIEKFKIKAPSQETKISTLSGGNQQKVILGRWLMTQPEVLLLDEPTRGIDISAKFEIYKIINSLANNGKTIIMVSSEMPELLGVCDRILVMSAGKLAGEITVADATQEKIMSLAAKYV